MPADDDWARPAGPSTGDEIKVPLNMRLVLVGPVVWVECRRMVAGGRACGARWTVGGVDSATIVDHMSINH